MAVCHHVSRNAALKVGQPGAPRHSWQNHQSCFQLLSFMTDHLSNRTDACIFLDQYLVLCLQGCSVTKTRRFSPCIQLSYCLNKLPCIQSSALLSWLSWWKSWYGIFQTGRPSLLLDLNSKLRCLHNDMTLRLVWKPHILFGQHRDKSIFYPAFGMVQL